MRATALAALLVGCTLLLWPADGPRAAARLDRISLLRSARAAGTVGRPAPGLGRRTRPRRRAPGRVAAAVESRATRRRHARAALDAPGAADLMSACLATGCAPADAAAAVAAAVGGPVGDALLTVVSTYRLGGDPAAAWRTLETEPALAALGRAAARAVETGAPLADTVAAIAADQRSALRAESGAAAQRVAVRAAAPLGLCFLPAFLLVGVVPVVAGMARSLLGSA